MKNPNRHYIKASVLQASTIIELENLLDFTRFIEVHSHKEIFLLSEAAKFAVLNNSTLLQLDCNGYETIEDYKKALQSGFPNAVTFYDAVTTGITTYEAYDLISKCGISDKYIYDAIEKQGYLSGFEAYKSHIEEKKNIPKEHNFQNPFELYTFANKNGFKDYLNFFKAFEKGFFQLSDFKVATEKGFSTAEDYKDAMAKGFPNQETYLRAKEVAVATFQQLTQKENLEIAYPNLLHDQSILLFILSKLEQGKKASVNKISALLDADLIEYKHPETCEIFSWFSSSLQDANAISDFLRSNNEVRKFGTYDPDGEFFEVNTIKDRSIVIDGSNVAHNTKKGKEEKPTIANLILMVNFLKSKGFTDILIIADASLRHKLADLDNLEKLSSIAKYEIAPAATTADSYLISHVKSKHCLLLSNDTFKDHKMLDSWTALNIDYYRLTFMITDGEVFMPDLK